MEKKNKEEILLKLDELIDIIKKDEKYKRYKYLKEELKKNKDLMKLINDIKKEEKERVNKEYRKEDISLNEKKINELKSNLESYPDYLEFQYLQEDLNNMFQSIKSILEDNINKINS